MELDSLDDYDKFIEESVNIRYQNAILYCNHYEDDIKNNREIIKNASEKLNKDIIDLNRVKEAKLKIEAFSKKYHIKLSKS
jgi:hypothetical protein